jgi:hypothetical protein
MRTSLSNLIFYLLVSTTLALPTIASAANIDFLLSTSTIQVGDTFSISVRLITDDEKINVLDGEIGLVDNRKISSFAGINLGNSAFSLWPNKPSLDDRTGRITFTGGTPGSVSNHESSLFNINIKAEREGTINLEPRTLNAYLDDGHGSKINIKGKTLTIKIGPDTDGIVSNHWQTVKTGDHTPPKVFRVESGQNIPTYPEGKFLSFFAEDNESGIAYYEVSENGREVVRTGNSYVLLDQKGGHRVKVIAYDHAGNKRVVVWTDGWNSLMANLGWWLTIIIITLLIIVVWRRLKIGSHPRL